MLDARRGEAFVAVYAGGRELVAIGLRGLGCLARGGRGGPQFFNCGVEVVHAALRRSGAGGGEGLLGDEGWMNDHAVAGEARRLDELVVPVDRERLRRLVDERLGEGVKIARVERGG